MKKWVRSLLAVVCSAVIAAETLPAAAFVVESSAGRQELTSESEAAAEPKNRCLWGRKYPSGKKK